ncbi:DNA polymerase III subunit delta [Paenibacillus sp. HJGM_3]|uniref:DNA polymerase III subunit delta n=1 Tax=Paenibacillus sp. HJGM_3 TaxID=3379816 RepID=UPI00385DF26A
MDYKSAAREIAKGGARPLYVCYGPERYLLQEFIQFLTDKLIDPAVREFAISRYDLAETSLDTVLEDAGTLPFMAEKKLVIAKNAVFLTGAKDTSKVEHNPEKLLDYLKTPSDFSVLVLLVDAEKLDERKKLVKAVKDSSVAFPALSAEDLIAWVGRQAERAGFSFAAGAADQFVLYAGSNLQTLSAEIEKLSLYVGQGGRVTGDVVDALVTRTTEQNVFILIEDIVRLRLQRAFTILQELIKMKEEPVKLTLLIARQFRIILQVKELSRQGYSQQQLASQLGLHPYAVKIAAEQGTKYKDEQLVRILEELAELDYKLKSGKIDKVLGLELFLLRLAA